MIAPCATVDRGTGSPDRRAGDLAAWARASGRAGVANLPRVASADGQRGLTV